MQFVPNSGGGSADRVYRPAVTANELSTLATGYWPAAALIAAVELNVFDALGDAARSVEAIATDLGVSAERLTQLLDALTAVNLLEKAPSGYAIPHAVRPLLSRSSPTCMVDALRYNADLYRHWSNLAAVVRGDASPAGRMQLGGDPAMTRRFVLGMEAKARAFAAAMAAALDLGDARTLLDVGSGPGTVSRQLLRDRPTLHATLLDLPPVLAVAEELWRGELSLDRVTFHPADYREGPLPGGFDCVMYAGALHQETPASAAALMKRMRRAMHPGGRLFMIDLTLDDGRTSPAFSALFQLNMLLLRPGSRVFATGEVTTLLVNAEFDAVIATDIAETPYRLITAEVGWSTPSKAHA